MGLFVTCSTCFLTDSCCIMSGESDCTRTSPSAGSPSDTELLPDRPKYVCTLSPDLVTKAREELQEKPEWRLRDVQALRDMVCKDYPSLGTCLDDAFLLRFLRARKFDYDRALQLLVNYHTCRRTWPEVFSNLKPSAIKPVLESGFVTVLPHRDPQGRHVVCIRPGTQPSLSLFPMLQVCQGQKPGPCSPVSSGDLHRACGLSQIWKADRGRHMLVLSQRYSSSFSCNNCGHGRMKMQ